MERPTIHRKDMGLLTELSLFIAIIFRPTLWALFQVRESLEFVQIHQSQQGWWSIPVEEALIQASERRVLTSCLSPMIEAQRRFDERVDLPSLKLSGFNVFLLFSMYFYVQYRKQRAWWDFHKLGPGWSAAFAPFWQGESGSSQVFIVL